jgi:hypothetical protein
MVSASSWSLIEGSEIFFTITECPLTAVATALVLIYDHRIDHDVGRQRLQAEVCDFNLPALFLELHRFDARGAYIQANN